MKFFQKTMAGVALASFTMAQPIAAHAAAASALPVRAASVGDTSEQLHGRGGNVLIIIAVFAALLLLAEVTGLIDVFGNDDDNGIPLSP